MNFVNAIAIAAILTSILTSGGSCQKSCSRNASLMKSIQYQLKLIGDNDGKCDCNQSPSTPSSGKVGFLVSNSGTLQKIDDGSVVMYDTVSTNLGGGYDKSTGMFTAPVEGLYYFTWTVLTPPGKSFYTQLLLNDTVVARNHAGALGISTHMPSSQSAVLQMKKNNKVSIRVYRGGLIMYGDKWSTFSGFKL
ncbi:cerebellin-3-like [Mytilus galloprovincialis]|uniref:complement C1q tumor necrosis factor-related protein 3-like n=1 Tax=Mytilus edulis TaxID=6550 RepID=UPI0039EE0FAF